MTQNRLISCCMVLGMVLAFSPKAHATLGERADSITADREALHAVQATSTPHGGYSVQEISSVASQVREYLLPSGVVFGVSWNGRVNPDLTQLLGSYWNEYSVAQQKGVRTFGRRSRKVATPNVVVQTWGHMRNLRGRAYLPALIPAGVAIDDIK